MRLIPAGGSLLLLVSILAGAGEAQELPEGVTAEMIEEGQEVYGGPGLCSVCHGPDGRGGPIGPDLSDDRWLHSDGSYESLVRTITEGVAEPVEAAGVMPPKGGSQITEEQVRAVAAYVWSLRRSG